MYCRSRTSSVPGTSGLPPAYQLSSVSGRSFAVVSCQQSFVVYWLESDGGDRLLSMAMPGPCLTLASITADINTDTLTLTLTLTLGDTHRHCQPLALTDGTDCGH